MNQKTLYLHIGSHKTGTTSIQSALSDNKILLAKHGLSLFDKITPELQNQYITKGSANSWVNCSNKHSIYHGCEIVQKELFAKELSQLEGNVIASSEKLSFVFQIEEIQILQKELTKYFNQIFIIVYIRRQDKQIISHYQQTTKYSNHFANSFFGNKPASLPDYQEYFYLYYDYNRKIDMWATIFGSENIIIRNYEEIDQNDAVHDFFKIFNINISSNINLNTSRGFEPVKIGHLIKKASIPENSHLYYNIFKKLDNSGKLLPSKDEAKFFYEKFKYSNYLLNEKFHINDKEFLFDDDFSMYPKKSTDTWDEESANKTICNLLLNMNESYGQIDLNHLINAAVHL